MLEPKKIDLLRICALVHKNLWLKLKKVEWIEKWKSIKISLYASKLIGYKKVLP